MKLRDNGHSNVFSFQNNKIHNSLKNAFTFRVGGEFKVIDEVAVRAGYAVETATCDKNGVLQLPDNTTRTDAEFFLNKYLTSYYSAGIGYRAKYWFLDFAYQLKQYKQDFYAYDDIMAMNFAPDTNYIPAKVKNFMNSFIVSFGIRF